MNAVVYLDHASLRSRRLGEALISGLSRLGCNVTVTHKALDEPVEVFAAYGWTKPIRRSCARQLAAGRHFLHVDLGFWGRKPPHDVLGGYHKVVLNRRHPLITLEREWPTDRLMQRLRAGEAALGPPRRARKGPVIVAGMSAKSAGTYGLAAEEWERGKILALRDLGLRVVYRPKPSWEEATALPGATFSSRDESLASLLETTSCLVTHHSNAAIDALAHGLPIQCEDGAALPLSTAFPWNAHADIDQESRDRLLAGLAYAQWSVEEISRGLFWRWLEPPGSAPS